MANHNLKGVTRSIKLENITDTPVASRRQNYALFQGRNIVIKDVVVAADEDTNRMMITFENMQGKIHKSVGITITKDMALKFGKMLIEKAELLDDRDPTFLLVRDLSTGKTVFRNPGIGLLAMKMGRKHKEEIDS